MENKQKQIIINFLCFALFVALLILICTSISYCIKFNSHDAYALEANAQEPTTITLKAGTYRFNDTPSIPNNFEQNIAFTITDGTQIIECNAMSVVDNTIADRGDGITYNTKCLKYSIKADDNRYYSIGVYNECESFKEWSTSPIAEDVLRNTTLEKDTEVDVTFGTWYITNTNYNEVNGINSTTIPYTNIDIPTDIQIMENINMDINGFGSTTSNDIVGISALNGETLGKLRTNDGSLIPFNGIAVTSFDSWRPNSTYVYPLTDTVNATEPFTISNGLMLYVWDDTQYYQVAWFNPADSLWYVHCDYAITVPYGHRSTSSIGTLTEGIAISLSITPNLSTDDIGYVELGAFEDTPPNANIISSAAEDAFSTFAMFCNANYISDSEKLAWGIAQHQSGLNLGQSQQLGENIIGQFLQAPIDILDSIVIYTTPNGTAVTLMGVFGALLTLSLVIIFLKLFAGG